MSSEQLHINHKIEALNLQAQNFIQKGVHIICTDNNEKELYSFCIPPIFVFRGKTEDGLLFENMKTGEKTTRIPPTLKSR